MGQGWGGVLRRGMMVGVPRGRGVLIGRGIAVIRSWGAWGVLVFVRFCEKGGFFGGGGMGRWLLLLMMRGMGYTFFLVDGWWEFFANVVVVVGVFRDHECPGPC